MERKTTTSRGRDLQSAPATDSTQASPSNNTTISREKFLSFAREMFGAGNSGNPDPDNPLPPGPWDPVIRKALARMVTVFGPSPEPWMPALAHAIANRLNLVALNPQPLPPKAGLLRDVLDLVSLNPQPLPPKAALASAIVQEVVERAVLMQEIADALPRAGQEQGIIIVGGLVSRFIDDCGNGRLWPKGPVPPKPPRGGQDNALSTLELLAMGAQFESAARETFNPGVRKQFEMAGARLTELGIARM